jgi:hypothetical protein
MVRRKIKSRRARTAAIDTTAISVDAVSVKNLYRVAAMLAPICEGDTIGDYLDVLKDGGAWAYEDTDATACYAACHGEKLRCFTVNGITKAKQRRLLLITISGMSVP